MSKPERYTISISRRYETDSGDNVINISTIPWRFISTEEEEGILKRIEAIINRNMEEIIGVKQPTIPTQYFISIGHIGTVWRGSDGDQAKRVYQSHCMEFAGSKTTVMLTSRHGETITRETNTD